MGRWLTESALGSSRPDRARTHVGDLKPWMRDFVGLLARSRNLNIQACVDRLPKNGRRVWRSMRGPFSSRSCAWALSQIQVSRRLLRFNKCARLRQVPAYCRQEWANHAAVRDVRRSRTNWIAPDRRRPRGREDILKLRALFASIQTELDATWAVLGEVYGSDRDLDKLRIEFAALATNLDDFGEFGATVGYVPELAGSGPSTPRC